MWIDTHCHLDAAEFGADAAAVRRRAAAAGVVHCVLPAVAPADFDAVRVLAHRHGDSYALGIHPLYTGAAGDDDLLLLDRMLAACRDDPRLVAVGEIGLDFFVPGLDAGKQERFYAAQLELARSHGLPVLPGEIGFSEEEFVAAVEYAPQTRPGRYTILEHLDLSTEAIRDAYADYAKTISS